MIRSYELGVLFLPSYWQSQSAHPTSPVLCKAAYSGPRASSHASVAAAPAREPAAAVGGDGAPTMDSDEDEDVRMAIAQSLEATPASSSAEVVTIDDSDADTIPESDSDQEPPRKQAAVGAGSCATPTPLAASPAPTGFRIVVGDLLNSSASFIAQQCNCNSTHGRGLAKALFERFPHANVYARRKGRSVPGACCPSTS